MTVRLTPKERLVLTAVYRYSWQSVHYGRAGVPSTVHRSATPPWRPASSIGMSDETFRGHVRALEALRLVSYTRGRGVARTARVGGRMASVAITKGGLQVLGAPDPSGEYQDPAGAAAAVNAARAWGSDTSERSGE